MPAPEQTAENSGSVTAQNHEVSNSSSNAAVEVESLRDQIQSLEAKLESERQVRNAKEQILNRKSTRLENVESVLRKAGIDSTAENVEQLLGERLTASERAELELNKKNKELSDAQSELTKLRERVEQSEKTNLLDSFVDELGVLPDYRGDAKTLVERHISRTKDGAFEISDKENISKDFQARHKSWIQSRAKDGSGFTGFTEGKPATGDPKSWTVEQKVEYVNKHGQEAFNKLARSHS